MFSVVAIRLADLKRRYAERHRSYHGQSHVDAMLRGLADESHRIVEPGAVELAIWYHDAIYDPAADDNEARSADLLREQLAGLIDAGPLGAADLMIRASADHAVPNGLPDQLRGDVATFLDLDMAILGATAAEYDAYEAGILAEFEPVYGAAAFRLGRAAFLKGVLARDRIFRTERFHSALDGRSRVNLRRALVTLRF